MKYRCPYCKGIIEGELHAECPHCHKAMNIPNHLRPASDRRERKRAKERIRREAQRQQQAIHVPGALFGRKPSHTLLILAGMAVIGALLVGRVQLAPKTSGAVRDIGVAQRELEVLHASIQDFHADCGRYPSIGEGLMSLIKNPGVPGWKGPYVTFIRSDPWGAPYVYACDGTNVVLLSSGPDGALHTADDLAPGTGSVIVPVPDPDTRAHLGSEIGLKPQPAV